MQANPTYAAFQVVDHLAQDMTHHVFQQTGTVKAIANPFTSTMLKLMVTKTAIEVNRAKTLAVTTLRTLDPASVASAKTDTLVAGGGRTYQRPVAPQDPDLGLVTYYDTGTTRGVYVDRVIADGINRHSVGHTLRVVQVLQFVNSQFFRPIFTTFSLGFQSYNLLRDFYRYWRNHPRSGLATQLKDYAHAMPLAVVRATGWTGGEWTPAAIRRALAAAADDLAAAKAVRILGGITYNDWLRGRRPDHALMEDALARTTGVQDLSHDEATDRSMRVASRRLLAPFRGLLAMLQGVADVVETLPKGAGIYNAARHYGDIQSIPADERAFIREALGSPDFLAGGTLKPVLNNILLFSNAMIQGLRSDARLAKTRAGWWWRLAEQVLLPKTLMFLGTAGGVGLIGRGLGLMDEDDEDVVQRILAAQSEYDLSNYLLIPVGVDGTGKGIVLRVPTDETGRMLGAIWWKMLQRGKGDRNVIALVRDVADYLGRDVPNLHPGLKALLGDLPTALAGGNPRDTFRDRPVWTDDELQAGGAQKWRKFIGYEFQQLGGGTVWRFTPGARRPRQVEGWQQILDLPVLSTVLKRWIRVSDYGLLEAAREAQAPVATTEAQRRLRARAAANETVRRYDAEKTGTAADRRLRRDLALETAQTLAQAEYPTDGRRRRAYRDRVYRRVRATLAFDDHATLMSGIVNAETVDQAIAAARGIVATGVTPDTLQEWLRFGLREGVLAETRFIAIRRALRTPRVE